MADRRAGAVVARLASRFAAAPVAVRSPGWLDLGCLGQISCALVLSESGRAGLGSMRLALLLDHDERLALCAAAEVPEVWLLDLACGWTEIYRYPDGGRYRRRALLLPGEEVAPLCLPELAVRVL